MAALSGAIINAEEIRLVVEQMNMRRNIDGWSKFALKTKKYFWFFNEN